MKAYLTPKQRNLMFCVADGDFRGLTFIHQIYLHKRGMQILAWFYANGITGKNFFEFISVRCQNSVLTAIKLALAKIDKEKETRPVFARDFLNL